MLKVKNVTVEDLITELQKYNPRLPIVLSRWRNGGYKESGFLRYWDGSALFTGQPLMIYAQEMANNLGQQGLGLVIEVEG